MTVLIENQSTGISYLERAAAPGSKETTVVFLHGIGSNALSFSKVMTELPGNVRAISWNAPGYLDSAPLTAFWPSAADYAVVLRQFLASMHIKKAVIVGHSLGTLIAAAFAAEFPDCTERLILVSCAKGGQADPADGLPENAIQRIRDIEILGPQKMAEERARTLVFEPLLNPEVVAQVEQAMSRVNRDGYSQASRMLASGNLPEALKSCRCDADFIVGVNDRATPEQQTLECAVAWSKVTGKRPKVHRVDQCGHALYVQKHGEFVDLLAAILESENTT